MGVVFTATGEVMKAGQHAPGLRMWAVLWRRFRGGKVETWGFIGSLSDVADLGAALKSLDPLEVQTGTTRGLGRRRMARACALTRARLLRDPKARTEFQMELGEVGYFGPLI